MTRRDFIETVARWGGSSFLALNGLGLLGTATGLGAELKDLPPVGSGPGRKVVILGAGIAGLTAAYELGKLGFECTILEASQRIGGRSLTLRGGDTFTDTLGRTQTCMYPEGHYFNAGPARFPSWHVTMDYCRELGVAIEPFVNVNESAFFYNEGVAGPLAGQRVRQRTARADWRGHTSALLAKVVQQDKLDHPLTVEDKERLIEFLRLDGDLDPDELAYFGSTRRGYRVWPAGGTQRGQVDEPSPLPDLLQAELARHFQRTTDVDYQPSLFQPVGGMDRLAHALAARVKERIILGAEARELRKTPGGVRVLFNQGGVSKEFAADYAVVTIPPPVLRTLATDFSYPLRTAINAVPFQNSSRIGLLFKRRFWEEDDRIYGGITWTNQPINEIYYPSHGFNDAKGVLIGYYMFGPAADEVAGMTPEERTEYALRQGEKIHPQYRAEFEHAVSVSWSTVPHIKGCLAHFPEALMKTLYTVLIKPEDRFYIAADWASPLGGWQAGAFEAARLAVKDIHTRTLANKA